MIGFGVHEGDWEFAQVALDSDGAPTVATYAQHDRSERCAWSQVRRTSAGAPVVYVALASHASYFASGVASRGWLPDDYHRGDGYRVRPQLEVVTPSTPFMAWRGRWGASSSSPIAPRRQGKWGDPAGVESNAAACTVPSGAAAATRRPPRSSVPAPRMRVRRLGGEVVVDYRFPAARRRPVTLLVSVAPAGAPDVATARRAAIRARTGTVRLAAPGADGPVVVQASAFSQRGTRSAVKRVRLPERVARLLAAALFAAAAFATWLAWIAYEVLCEEGCAGRPWPLVAQLIVACAGLPLAAVAVAAARGRAG